MIFLHVANDRSGDGMAELLIFKLFTVLNFKVIFIINDFMLVKILVLLEIWI